MIRAVLPRNATAARWRSTSGRSILFLLSVEDRSDHFPLDQIIDRHKGIKCWATHFAMGGRFPFAGTEGWACSLEVMLLCWREHRPKLGLRDKSPWAFVSLLLAAHHLWTRPRSRVRYGQRRVSASADTSIGKAPRNRPWIPRREVPAPNLSMRSVRWTDEILCASAGKHIGGTVMTS